MSIKGLPVIISPSCAHLVDEGSVSYNDSSINRLERSNMLEEWSKGPIFTWILVESAQGGIVGNCSKKQQVRVSFLWLSISLVLQIALYHRIKAQEPLPFTAKKKKKNGSKCWKFALILIFTDWSKFCSTASVPIKCVSRQTTPEDIFISQVIKSRSRKTSQYGCR